MKVLVLKNLERGFYVGFFPVLFWLVLGTETYVSAGEHHTNLWGSCGSAGVLFQCYQKVYKELNLPFLCRSSVRCQFSVQMRLSY